MFVLVVDFDSELFIVVREMLIDCLAYFIESKLGKMWTTHRTSIMMDMVTNHDYPNFKIEMFNQPEHVQNIILLTSDEMKPKEVKIFKTAQSDTDQLVMNEIKTKSSENRKFELEMSFCLA